VKTPHFPAESRVARWLRDITKAGKDPAQAIAALAGLLQTHPDLFQERSADATDTEITCTLCHNEQWWRDNYGENWEWARWWYCGPFGLDCPPAG